MRVRVNEVGGVFGEFEVNAGSTVRQALVKAQANVIVSKQILVNQEEADLDTVLSNGDSIYVVPNMKGN